MQNLHLLCNQAYTILYYPYHTWISSRNW